MGASHSRTTPKKPSDKQVSGQSLRLSCGFHQSQTVNLNSVSPDSGQVHRYKDKGTRCRLIISAPLLDDILVPRKEHNRNVKFFNIRFFVDIAEAFRL